MNYENPELLDRLAAEYVLGTLRGQARRRFERLCDAKPNARIVRSRWEDDLLEISRRLDPVQPSAHVWQQIRRRIGGNEQFRSRSRLAPRMWQLAVAASIAFIGLVVGLLVYERPAPMQALATLGTDAARPLWRIERPKEFGALRIRVVGTVQVAADRSYELWALPKGGQPVSLGLLPRAGQLDRVLTGSQRVALLAADKVAVSLEPAGGSRTGSPSGPIVIVVNVPAAG